ncbi:hypothetical protein [Streptomyces sp. NPDC018045]|uniref:hypothetical protein n=1 Tax=Streptomyces sp. NPDC018045 TaxID=3365037 RepID=UPI0037A28E4C
MRKFIGRTAGAVAIAALAVVPLSGMASAASWDDAPRLSAGNNCGAKYGKFHCDRVHKEHNEYNDNKAYTYNDNDTYKFKYKKNVTKVGLAIGNVEQ